MHAVPDSGRHRYPLGEPGSSRRFLQETEPIVPAAKATDDAHLPRQSTLGTGRFPPARWPELRGPFHQSQDWSLFGLPPRQPWHHPEPPGVQTAPAGHQVEHLPSAGRRCLEEYLRQSTVLLLVRAGTLSQAVRAVAGLALAPTSPMPRRAPWANRSRQEELHTQSSRLPASRTRTNEPLAPCVNPCGQSFAIRRFGDCNL